jgi:hypothetical protein
MSRLVARGKTLDLALHWRSVAAATLATVSRTTGAPRDPMARPGSAGVWALT